MKIAGLLTDDSVLTELGRRVARERIARNMTQADLAVEAGLSLSTVARLEKGAGAQLVGFIRVLRAMGLLEGLDDILLAGETGPIDELRATRTAHQPRQRARSKTGTKKPSWQWADV